MFDLRRTLAVVLFAAAAAAAAPAASASEKYVVHEDKPVPSALAPAPGKALVLFCRSQVMGAAVKVKLYADGTFLGIIMSRNYIPYECDPGKHEFIAAAENAGFLEAELEAGKIYLVQVSIHMGALKARTHFETARRDSEALTEITKVHEDLRLVTTTDEGRAWAAEKEEEFQKTIARYRAKGEEFEQCAPADGWDRLPWAK